MTQALTAPAADGYNPPLSARSLLAEALAGSAIAWTIVASSGASIDVEVTYRLYRPDAQGYGVCSALARTYCTLEQDESGTWTLVGEPGSLCEMDAAELEADVNAGRKAKFRDVELKVAA